MNNSDTIFLKPKRNITTKFRFKKPKLKSLKQFLLALMVLPLIFVTFKLFGVIFTYSGSVPVGFYRIIHSSVAIHSNDYVSFCLPNNVASMGIHRGYIEKGNCNNGSQPLIKQVIAVPGDTVNVNYNLVTVTHDNLTISYSAVIQPIDKNNLTIHRYIKNGQYKLTGYWVYGVGDPKDSWDSRYYGQISKKQITHKLIPLCLF